MAKCRQCQQECKIYFCSKSCYWISLKGKSSWQGRKHTQATKDKCSLSNLGKRYSPATEFKKGQISPRKGVKLPPEQIDLMREVLFKPGHIPWNKGVGIPTLARSIRNSRKYKEWVKSIKSLYSSCKICGSRDKLEADHLLPIFTHPELAYDIGNGQLLCRECHKNTPTYGGRVKAAIE